ncbi:MAG: tetratricopeptide repeat protein [Cellvibrionaceae bacterium]|nr:tetratricopeptide repeat protein [Cellvibrionaceae bacterium]
MAAVLQLLLVSDVSAQANVRNSTPVTTGAAVSLSAPVVNPIAAPADQTSSAKLFYQLQLLQEEIMQLRGLVEEQSFALKRLKQQRLDDYLDLDKRIAALSAASKGGAQAASAQPATSQPLAAQRNSLQNPARAQASVVDMVSTDTALATTQASTLADEQTLYNQTINLLLDKQDYQAATLGFKQYLSSYPRGVYAANVYYWQGQIHLTEGDSSAAQAAFAKIISDYPDHQKTPDAKFKLAKIYFAQGRKQDAKHLLDDVIAANTDVSQLARTFLENNF